ncbi:tryptophan--tRNA ligase [Nocardia sp. SC052]|uniref:tryptophan--tRNA ligase n=1 Tax=Nocardia sichangensis TaxID=3385975 RepID=UPI0039A1EA7E
MGDPMTVSGARVMDNPHRYRVLTGDRPTGHLHIGHYFGTLQNRVRLAEAGVELFVVVADYQVITDRRVGADITRTVNDLVLDYLACGLDSAATIFTHSSIAELNQLLLPFLSLVSVAELERNPTVKSEIEAMQRPVVNGLMFTYPVHQAADILSMRANLVPVGKDQLPHVEICRTIARRFNDQYSHGRPYLPVPQALLGDAPNVLGLDGRKMSKSLGNSISISATPDQTRDLIRQARTDNDRQITFDPDNRPTVSNLLLVAGLCQNRTPDSIAAEIGDGGGAELKRVVAESVNEYFRPIRRRRAELAEDNHIVRDTLAKGNETARQVAAVTLDDVKSLMGMLYT